MILIILHQLLKLAETKTDLDTSDSFWAQKWPIYAPKTAVLDEFWTSEVVYTFLISKMDET